MPNGRGADQMDLWDTPPARRKKRSEPAPDPEDTPEWRLRRHVTVAIAAMRILMMDDEPDRRCEDDGVERNYKELLRRTVDELSEFRDALQRPAGCYQQIARSFRLFQPSAFKGQTRPNARAST
jgi:hypothetical protein